MSEMSDRAKEFCAKYELGLRECTNLANYFLKFASDEVERAIKEHEETVWNAARKYYDNPTKSGIEINISIESRWKYLTIEDWRKNK